jgi:hypothetical protein
LERKLYGERFNGGYRISSLEETKTMKTKIILALLTLALTACAPAMTPAISMTSVQSTAIAAAYTGIALTQTALPTATPTPPPVPTSEPTLFFTRMPSMPSKTPTGISPYEAEHEAIRKVIASYFDQIYYMHSSFQVGGLSDVISSAPDGRLFLKTKLRQLAGDITWERQSFRRYASYKYTLNYSEIVVFDSAQRARANFTEEHSITYEYWIPYGFGSFPDSTDHIIMLRNETSGWKIIYDVYIDDSLHSLYAPTPFPQDVLSELDKQLINLNKAQGGPALPQEGKIFISSDPAQLERWKEYETALAEKLMPQYPRDTVLCEWELTDKSEHKINVWALCITSVTSANIGNYYYPAASVPAVITLEYGAIQSVEIPEYGENYLSDIWQLFPNGAWKSLGYDNWKNLPNAEAMEKHLHWRMTHPAEPPLVVLNATAILTATPIATPTP